MLGASQSRAYHVTETECISYSTRLSTYVPVSSQWLHFTSATCSTSGSNPFTLNLPLLPLGHLPLVTG
jgi:hypothetical protein